jgi:hypothetical protein
LEQAKAQAVTDMNALKDEMKKLNEDWIRRFQALQGWSRLCYGSAHWQLQVEASFLVPFQPSTKPLPVIYSSRKQLCRL